MSRPTHRITAKRKDGAKDAAIVNVMAGWPGKHPGQVGFKLERGWKLIGPNGEEIDGTQHWIDLREDKEQGPKREDPELDWGRPQKPGNDGDIPF